MGIWDFPYTIIEKLQLFSVHKSTLCEINGQQVWQIIDPIFQKGKKISFTNYRAINMMGLLGENLDQTIKNLVCEHEIKKLKEPARVH